MCDIETTSDLLCKKLNILLSHPEFIVDFQYVEDKVEVCFEFGDIPNCRISFVAVLEDSKYIATLNLFYFDGPKGRRKLIYSTKVGSPIFNQMKDVCVKRKVQKDLNKVLNLIYTL